MTPSCRPERVTGYVDGALEPEETARVAAHLESCPNCRAQAEAERALRESLRALPAPEPRAGFEAELRQLSRRGSAVRLARVLLPLAAGLVVAVLWARGSPGAIAFELSRDHAHCFGMAPLPAQVVSGDPALVTAWFERQGTAMPTVPAQAAGLTLQGARYCPLLDLSSVAHLYYRDGARQLSLFVLSRGLRMGQSSRTTALGRDVRLLADGERTLAVVGERAADVDSFQAALLTRTARASFPAFD
jgi:anti-sigma factor RsiW